MKSENSPDSPHQKHPPHTTISANISAKLKLLPASPGVYFHKNSQNEIIYIGKAAVLKNRVRQYFQNSPKDPKTTNLIQEITDIEWRTTDSEIDALFLESELIKRYQPKWNILLKDDKTVSYAKITLSEPIPTITLTRTPLDDKATYVGPFYGRQALKNALKTLRKSFPYLEPTNITTKSKLYTQINLAPDLKNQDPLSNEPDPIKLKNYRKNLRRLILYLENGKHTLLKQLQKDMESSAKRQDFESAAKFRNQINTLKELERKIIFSDAENIELSKDQALIDLQNLLNLPTPPRRIEGFDISHHSGTNAVASMVVFTNGVSDRTSYRKFKIRHSKNNDFKNLQEVLTRRFKHSEWPMPDLILIDGGIPQLDFLKDTLSTYQIPYLGLAERFDHIIIPIKNPSINAKQIQKYQEIILPPSSHLLKLLQRIRDEAHRFAITYHSYLKRKNMLK